MNYLTLSVVSWSGLDTKKCARGLLTAWIDPSKIVDDDASIYARKADTA